MKVGDLVRKRTNAYRKEPASYTGILLEEECRSASGSGPLSTKIEHKGKILDFTMPTGGEPNTRPGWLVITNGIIEWWEENSIILEQSTTHLG